MRIRFLALLPAVAALALAQNPKADRPAAAKKTTMKAPPPVVAEGAPARKPIAPPEGSKEVRPGVWRYVDSGGKAWIYRRSPFGLSKAEEAEASQDAAAPDGAAPASHADAHGLLAVEKDGVIEFSRATPFGPRRWTRTKDDLDEMEKAAWERARAADSRPAARPQSNATAAAKSTQE
jgi:hypothetical protein